MTAPLYQRYRRYADREANRFPKKSLIRRLIPAWKKPNTRVYSFSDRCSHEAGWWSSSEPKELLRAINLHYLPTPYVWAEIDFRQYQRGSNHIDFDSDHVGLSYTKGEVRAGDDDRAPLRMGFLYYSPAEHHTRVAEHIGIETTLSCLTFYLYPSGSSHIGPANAAWSLTDQPFPAEQNHYDPAMALGNWYEQVWRDRTPRLLKQLHSRVYLAGVYAGVATKSDIGGTTRMAIAVLTAALAARRNDIDPNLTRNPQDPSARRERTPENKRPIEVDLFIRERPKRPGGSIRASVGHMEGVKKGLHTVGAHYAYRARRDGGDPSKCTNSPQHDFEKIDGTKSEVCVFCGQKRWFKRAHERGDEAFGVVPQKTYNVRAGSPFTPYKQEDKA